VLRLIGGVLSGPGENPEWLIMDVGVFGRW
jgi:hypothetical protein